MAIGDERLLQAYYADNEQRYAVAHPFTEASANAGSTCWAARFAVISRLAAACWTSAPAVVSFI